MRRIYHPARRAGGWLAGRRLSCADRRLPAPGADHRGGALVRGLLQEVVTGLDRIAEAHGTLVLGGAGRTVENLLMLELANTARPRLAHMLAQNLHHPCALFEELAGLAGRMATYGSSSRRLTTCQTTTTSTAPAFAPWPIRCAR